MDKQELTKKHNFINDTIFRLKTFVLVGNRFFKNEKSPIKKFKNNQLLTDKPVVAFSESDLWNPFDNKDNWILTAGKVENLRIASKKLNGIEVKANEIFSFWKHIGNPNIGQGYVTGREIREGCVLPTKAGGLCQLSNALYDAALKANFEIIERHKHTKVIKGSLAEQNRDATVKWNYVDLRFKSSFDFKIEVELNTEKLVVTFKSEQNNLKPQDNSHEVRHFSHLNDCYSCGNFACFKHPDRSSEKQEIATTTFILDKKWPEYDDYIQSIFNDADNFIVPLKKYKFLKSNRYSWSALNAKNTTSTCIKGIYRAFKLRYASKEQNNIFELMLQLDRKIAIAAAKKIPVDSTHLVISQNLLPFIYETGALGGRTFDVLMTRLPFEKLHERLDFAYSMHNESKTLKDFRVSQRIVDLENSALTKARKVVTPHAEIAKMFKNKVEKLNWKLPKTTSLDAVGSKILFPASAVGRKGAYEIKKLAKELNFDLVISGRTLESENFWEGKVPQKFDGDYKSIALVVYPTFIENQPRQILKAISKGIPVITTTACGIDDVERVKIFNMNDLDRVRAEVKRMLSTTKSLTNR